MDGVVSALFWRHTVVFRFTRANSSAMGGPVIALLPDKQDWMLEHFDMHDLYIDHLVFTHPLRAAFGERSA